MGGALTHTGVHSGTHLDEDEWLMTVGRNKPLIAAWMCMTAPCMVYNGLLAGMLSVVAVLECLQATAVHTMLATVHH